MSGLGYLPGKRAASICLAAAAGILLALWATIAAAQEYVPLFSDDFSSGKLESWRVQSKDGGKAYIGSDSPEQSWFLECIPAVACYAGDASWTDYVFKSRFYLISGSAVFRVRQSDLAYVVRAAQDSISLWKEKSGPDYKIWELASVPAKIELNRWYYLGITCQGTSLGAFFADTPGSNLAELHYEDKQDPLTSGAIAIGAGPFEGNARVRFAQVAVDGIKNPPPTTKQTAPSGSTSPPSPSSSVKPDMPTGSPAQSSPTPESGLPASSVASIVSASVAVVTFGILLLARRSASRQNRRVKKLIGEIDTVYGRFKMNARRCEAELYRLRDLIAIDLKEGKLEGSSFGILDKRLEEYMKEIQERIIDEGLGNFPAKLKAALASLAQKGEMDLAQLDALDRLISATDGIADADKVRLRQTLERWRRDLPPKDGGQRIS